MMILFSFEIWHFRISVPGMLGFLLRICASEPSNSFEREPHKAYISHGVWAEAAVLLPEWADSLQRLSACVQVPHPLARKNTLRAEARAHC